MVTAFGVIRISRKGTQLTSLVRTNCSETLNRRRDGEVELLLVNEAAMDEFQTQQLMNSCSVISGSPKVTVHDFLNLFLLNIRPSQCSAIKQHFSNIL